MWWRPFQDPFQTKFQTVAFTPYKAFLEKRGLELVALSHCLHNF